MDNKKINNLSDEARKKLAEIIIDKQMIVRCCDEEILIELYNAGLVDIWEEEGGTRQVWFGTPTNDGHSVFPYDGRLVSSSEWAEIQEQDTKSNK